MIPKLVVDGGDPKSDPSVATHTTNGISDTDTTNKILLQKYSAEVDKLCSTEIDNSEYTHMPNFNVSNIFECGRNNPDVSDERAYMATEGN